MESHVNQEEYLQLLQKVSNLNDTNQAKKYLLKCQERYNEILKQISTLDHSDVDQLLNVAVCCENRYEGYAEDECSGDEDSQIAAYYCGRYEVLRRKYYDYVRKIPKNVLDEYQIWAKHIDTIPNYRAAEDTINEALAIYLEELKKLTSFDYKNYILKHEDKRACPVNDIREKITGVHPNRNKYNRLINSYKKEFYKHLDDYLNFSNNST